MIPVALVPGVLALLPSYASIQDPVAELRSACQSAVGRLGPRVRVVAATDSSRRVGAALIAAAGAGVVADGETGVLVVANGSAKRTEKAPGSFDERAEAYDAALRSCLLGDLDIDSLPAGAGGLAGELWAEPAGLGALSVAVAPGHSADLLYDDAPFGVQYWVAVWV